MTVKLRNVTKWKLLPIGDVLYLAKPEPRLIRLEVNCVGETRVDVVVEETHVFLWAGQGLQTIEFAVPGPCALIFTSESEVFYATDDSGDAGVVDMEETPFTSIMNRRVRNPQMELMMFKMEQNINRRLDQQREEYEAQLARLGHDPDTGEVNDDDDEEVSPNPDGGSAGTSPDGNPAPAAKKDEGKSDDDGTKP